MKIKFNNIFYQFFMVDIKSALFYCIFLFLFNLSIFLIMFSVLKNSLVLVKSGLFLCYFYNSHS